MSNAMILSVLGKSLFLVTAWIMLELTFFDMIFIMFSVDVISLLIVNYLWRDDR